MASALIALGGNLGNVRAAFESAIPKIRDKTGGRLVARSSDYATPPWGAERQPAYVNACIEIETTIEPHGLLAVLHEVEREHGRDRSREQRFGPRTLDLDLLAYDDRSLDTPALTLPHPRLFERAFVLVPLAEIAPSRPIAGRTAQDALATLKTDGIRKLG